MTKSGNCRAYHACPFLALCESSRNYCSKDGITYNTAFSVDRMDFPIRWSKTKKPITVEIPHVGSLAPPSTGKSANRYVGL